MGCAMRPTRPIGVSLPVCGNRNYALREPSVESTRHGDPRRFLTKASSEISPAARPKLTAGASRRGTAGDQRSCRPDARGLLAERVSFIAWELTVGCWGSPCVEQRVSFSHPRQAADLVQSLTAVHEFR
jgi:hypothetical protein